MSGSGRAEDARRALEQRYRQLASYGERNPLAATLVRFLEIDGSTLGVVVSVLLFTTVIPLMILGFSYLDGFAENVSPGKIWIRELGLGHPRSDQVRVAFGDASGLRSTWTFFGVAGFLIWGVPMAVTIAAIFARAWRRPPLPLVQRALRGSVWFLAYLAMVVCRERIAFGGDHNGWTRVLLFAVALIPVWLFWSVTPVLLVSHSGRGWSYLAIAGFAGVVIDGVTIPLAGRLFFPPLLDGWNGFGPIGVAMALLTWCAVIGSGWILTACLGAVLWERNAPPGAVAEFQSAHPERRW